MGRGRRTNAVGTANVVRGAQRPASRASSTSRPRSATASTRRSSRSRSRTRSTRRSSYAISKTAGECYVRLSGLDWVSFRLANVYGPRNLSGPLPDVLPAAERGQAVLRRSTRGATSSSSDDLVDVALKAVDGGGESGVYHVSSGSDVSIKELFDATVAAIGIELEDEVEVRAAEPRRRALDPARPVEDRARLRLAADTRSRRASRRRSPTTGSTASRRRTRTCGR